MSRTLYIPSIKPVPQPAPKSARNTQEKTEYRKIAYDQIYELKMLESVYLDGYGIQRVPGGWIFDRNKASVFVPYTEKDSNQTNIKL